MSDSWYPSLKKVINLCLNGQGTKIKLIESNLKKVLIRILKKYNFFAIILDFSLFWTEEKTWKFLNNLINTC